MTFWPAGFDPRDLVVRMLDLCELDTPDGPQRFIIGTDGAFTDIDGHTWVGSQLISASAMEQQIGSVAPGGSLTLSYFQAPDAGNLIQQVRELGLSYIEGREIRFFVQPIGSQAQFYAPVYPPKRWQTRIMKALTFDKQGALERSISLGYESWHEDRRAARRLVMNTEGHAALIGEENPSTEFIPTGSVQLEALF